MKGISKDQKTITINLKAKRIGKQLKCKGCWFASEGNCSERMCCESERADKKNIIWVEKC